MATFGHGIAATLSIGSAFGGYIESASMDLSRELAEIKVLTSTAIARVAGLQDCKFTSDGDYDQTADGLLWAALTSSAPTAVIFKPQATTAFTVNCWIESYSIAATSGDKVTFTVALSGAGTLSRV